VREGEGWRRPRGVRGKDEEGEVGGSCTEEIYARTVDEKHVALEITF
jgi:hypothetical protein